MKLVYALVLIYNVAMCLGAPLEQRGWESDPEFTGGYFQGDIILDVTRNGVMQKIRYWPNGIIYYTIDSIFDEEHRAAIRSAMDTIEANSCVHFVEVGAGEKLHYVKITGHKIGCNAQVGNWRREQILNLQLYPLNSGCFVSGKVIHELMHVIGFQHMHSVENRDAYIEVLTENIQDDFVKDFEKHVSNDFGVGYDYASIMHYPAMAFTKNGLPTIVARQQLPPGLMGQRDAMTPSDILKLNLMYRCFEKSLQERNQKS